VDSSQRISTPQAFEVPPEIARRETSTVMLYEPAPWWCGVTSWAIAAGVVAFMLILMTAGLRSRSAATPPPIDGTVLHVAASEAGCARLDRPVRGRLAVDVMEDGRVARAATGENLGVIRPCLEAHARSWEFLPQARPVSLQLDVILEPR
jgi:hypothetical protein